jgi:preprotein translocase subunit SecE
VKQNDYIILGIWVAVIGAVFLFLWQKGYLARLANYVAETREELKKCTWPSWDELKGSTLVVMISIIILGVFTVGIDQVVYHFVRWVVMQ